MSQLKSCTTALDNNSLYETIKCMALNEDLWEGKANNYFIEKKNFLKDIKKTNNSIKQITIQN